jgi:hypothetical protein
MKRLIVFSLAVVFLGLSCQIGSGAGTGVKVDGLLPDPQVGLAGLADYHAELTVGGWSASTGTFVQNSWPALGANFVAYEGTDEEGRPISILSGEVGRAHYSRMGESGDCLVQWGKEPRAEGRQPFIVASSLLPVDSAKSAGEETVEGISTRHYTFDGGSLSLAKDAEAAGEVWIAVQGGYVVKYDLQIEGANPSSGTGAQSARRIEYLLSGIGTRPQVEYPDGCRPVLTDVPAMDDAVDIIRLPGMLDYSSQSPLDSIASFYADYFTSGGWLQVGETQPNEDRSVAVFAKEDSEDIALVVVRRGADTQRVTVSLFYEETGGDSTPVPGPTQDFGADPAVRVVNGLNILLGMDESHPAPSSFHMEAIHNIPGWKDGGVIHVEDWMIADVEGENVHFVDRETASDGSVSETEAYLIGELQYDVEGGVVQPPGVSMKKLAWVMWPLDPITILGAGAGSAQSAGTEVIDGRTAEIYDIDAGGDALSGASGVSLNITAVKGRVWIDRETGAPVKAELDYRADVKDADGKVMDNADGRLEISVTKIGKVTVGLPSQ